ncbi:MAG: STAS domain-containing protein [Planctomycetes bacterium]|nr:STAS domain-containing protein [Planctomycetota bacterium]
MPLVAAEDGNLLTLFVDGAIDSGLGGELLATTSQAVAGGKRRVLVNLQKAKQANSAGLEALVRTATTVTAASGRFALVGPPPVLCDVLKATRLDKRFAVFESTEQAIAGLRRE